MRGTRWFLILAILAILGGIAVSYRLQKKILQVHALPTPAKMPADLKSSSEDWVFSQTDGPNAKVEVRARKVSEVKNSGLTHLENVRLTIFNKDSDTYDIVQCTEADLRQSDRRLYSDGAVEITLKVPLDGPPKKQPVTIHTTGLTYETGSNKAFTERAVKFDFENGTGHAVGASYDPGAKQLKLWSQVELDWKAPGPNARPMKVEAGELTYQEGGGKVWLAPWARLTRENAVMESAAAVVTLDDGRIRAVDASKGHGTDNEPSRKLDYAADQLWLKFNDAGIVESVAGEPNAHLTNTTEASVTTVSANRIALDFAPQGGASVLTHVLSSGNSVAESKPVPVPGKTTPERRVLRSANIDMKMRPGGKEIDSVEVPEAGTLEFFPNAPGQRHRTLAGAHMWIVYGPENRIQSFRTVDATTQSDPVPEDPGRKGKTQAREPARTASKNLTATFDPKTGQMTRLEQWDNFTYQEGDRNARAARAVLEQGQNLITLETGAKMWDASGSTFADHIRMDQKSGNFEASGRVASSHKNDEKNSSSDLLSGDQPLQAVADTMQSGNRNRLVHYQGKVTLWQGANRLRAQDVVIDREKRRLTAHGNVVTEFTDEQKDDDKPSEPAQRVFTIVHADNLVYTEADRLASYSGSVTLTRPPLQVKASAIRAFLAEKGADNRLEKAYADGSVSIVQKTPGRTRTGNSDHAEYYTGDERVILTGGKPQLSDSYRGVLTGKVLTYYVDSERLLADGGPAQPAATRVRGKRNLPVTPAK